jgi:hypothetical protein
MRADREADEDAREAVSETNVSRMTASGMTVSRVSGSRIVVGAVVALLLGIVLFVSSMEVHLVSRLEYMLATAALGVAPVSVGALGSVPLVRRMENLRIPIIAQAFVAAVAFAVLCGALAGVGYAVAGSDGWLPAYLAAAVAAWCAFLGLLAAWLLQRFPLLFRAAVAISVGAVVAGIVLTIT